MSLFPYSTSSAADTEDKSPLPSFKDQMRSAEVNENDESILPIVNARLVTASQISHEEDGTSPQRTRDLEQQVAARREQIERERQRLLRAELEELENEQRRLHLETKDRLKQQRGTETITSKSNLDDSGSLVDLDEYEDEHTSEDVGIVKRSSKQNETTPPPKEPYSLTQETQTSQQQVSATQSKQISPIRIVLVLIALVLLGVGAFCGTGNCKAKSQVAPVSPTNPSKGPTVIESATPVNAIGPTAPPTTASSLAPVGPVLPPRARAIVSFINSITLSGQTLQYPSDSTAEERALQWVIDEDLVTDESNVLGLLQRYALATISYSVGPFHVDSWLTSEEECMWHTITCTDEGEVTRVWLTNIGLTGQLPMDLGLLTAMTNLRFQVNELTGTIPSTLGKLTALTYLSVRSNKMAGLIPTEISQLSALEAFFVYNNNLSGSMPICNGVGASRPDSILFLEADCNEVDCQCCTECCPKGGFGGIPSGNTTCDA